MFTSALSFTLRDAMREIQPSPFDRHYGSRSTRRPTSSCAGAFRFASTCCSRYGLVHGGVHASIAERSPRSGRTVGVVPAGSIGLGMSNNSTFLRSIREWPRSTRLRAASTADGRPGLDVEVTDDDGRLCPSAA